MVGVLNYSQRELSAAVRTVSLSAENADGARIQQALDGVPEGGEVFLEAGTYVVYRPIVLQRNHVSLRGSGQGTVLFLKDNANCPVIILGAPDRQPRPASHVGLSDLRIDGNRTKQQGELWRVASDGSLINNNGVDIRNVTDSMVENVTCVRCRSGGLVTSGDVRRLIVRAFTASDNQFDGLACYQTEDSEFTGLSLHDNPAAGISLDLSFNHNVIDGAVLERNDLGIFMRNARSNTFNRVSIRASRNHGVFMAQVAEETAKGWMLFPGTECTDNRFMDLDIRNSGGSAFRINDVSCKNNLIAGINFLDNRGGGLAEAEAKLVKVERMGN